MADNGKELGSAIKRRRIMVPLTLRKMAVASGVSASHLGRIEKGERFPSASVLRKMAEPLGFTESELFSLAGYLSPASADMGKGKDDDTGGQLNPYVRQILSREPVEVQRTVIGIFTILKSLARVPEESSNN